MGIFSSRDDATVGSAIDELLSQKILAPKTFLSPLDGEEYIRVYGQTKYADIRSRMVQGALAEGEPFWQAKVLLEPAVSDDEGSVEKRIFKIRAGKHVVGELSEFDRRAVEVLKFDGNHSYVARAVIQDDLIGCLVQLFVDPRNQVL